MTRAVLLTLVGFVAAIVQGVLLHFGWPDTFLPQLVVIAVIYMGFNEIGILNSLIVFLWGLLVDLSSALLLGPWAGALVTVYGCLVLLSSRLFIDSPIVAAFISFFVTVFANGMYLLLGYEYSSIDWDDMNRIGGQALATAVVAPIFLSMVARKLRKRGSPGLGRSLAASATS